MGALTNVLAFLLVLGVLVVVHELGHFLAARFFDVRVERFAFGFGPRLFGFKHGETDYRVCLYPLGGYVKMAGEQIGEPTGDPREFLSKPRWQRLIIFAMGPIFNGILAVVLLTGLFLNHFEALTYVGQQAEIVEVAEGSSAAAVGILPGDVIVSFDGETTPSWESVRLAEITAVNRTVEVGIRRGEELLTFNVPIDPTEEHGIGEAGWAPATNVQLDPTPGSEAEAAGIEKGDIVVSINGRPMRKVQSVLDEVMASGGEPLDFTLRRGDEIVTVTARPKADATDEDGKTVFRIGAYIGPARQVKSLSFGEALSESLKANEQNATLILRFLKGLFEQRMSPKSLEGPIGIARISGEAAQQGLPDLIGLMASISLNLGIFNLLPIPMLDGGGILLLLFESAMRRDISMAVKERVIQVGLVFLVLLFAFVIYNDILKSLPGG